MEKGEKVIKIIQDKAKTGFIGDGKIFIGFSRRGCVYGENREGWFIACYKVCLSFLRKWKTRKLEVSDSCFRRNDINRRSNDERDYCNYQKGQTP